MAVGASALASKEGATALGKLSQATNNNATAVGPDSVASGSSSVALGHNSKAQANNTITIGAGANATKDAAGSLVIGRGALVNATDATVVGPVAQANGANATAVGRGAAANGIESTALGRGATATGNQTVALGQGAQAKVDSGVALGDGAVADRTARNQNGIVINTSDPSKSTGFNDQDAATNNSVYAPVRLVDAPEALKLIKDTIKGNKGAVSVGDSGNTRQIINVAAGSADSDAVNVAQLKAVAGAIKHYDVTSPNGDITVTHPNPEDPNKTVWNLNLNPDRVKEITKWKLRDVDKNGNPETGKTDALVKGDETVTFQDTDTIDVERVGTDGKTLKFHTKKNIKYFSVNSSGGGNENNNGATAANAIAIGRDASSTGSSAVSLGFEAKALGSYNTAIGPGAQAKDVRTTAVGYNATAEAASAVGIGYEAHATHSRSLAIGQDATASANNAIALGSSGQQSGNDRPNKTTASAEHAVAIGSGAVANIADGIALGSKSETTATSASGQSGFDASQEAEGVRKNKYNGLTGKNLTSNLAGLSIGNDGKTRQINHLAAGKADDDAVNVAQLKSVNLAFKGDNNTKGDVRLHDQRLSVVGATNDFITTKAIDNKLEISTTQGTFSTTNGKSSSTASGLATTNAVADTINKTYWQLQADGSQVGDVNPGDKVNIASGNGITVTPTTEANGVSKITINATVAGINAGRNVTVETTNGVSTINAIDTNTQASVSKAANSPITINATGAANAKNYELDVNVDKTTITKTGGVLKAVTGNLNVNDNGNLNTPQTGSALVNATTLTNVVNNTYWKAAAGGNHADGKTNLPADKVKSSSTVTFNVGKNLTVDHSVANNFTFALNNDINLTNTGSLTIGETKVDNGGVTITPAAGKSPVTLTANGLDNGNNKIVNVANGTNPTDAVNKSQLDDSISTESVVKADAEAGDKNIATITVADSKNTGDKGAKYQVGVSEKAVKEAARNAIDVTGTNFISATSNVAGDVETHTVTATTNAVTMTTEGKANTPTATGLTTNKDVADAINASGWKISEGDTSKGIVNPGNEVSFKGGEGTEVTVSDTDGNGKRTVTIASTVKPNQYAGDNYVAAKDNQAESNVIAKKANERLDIVGGAKGNLTEGNIGVNAKDGKLHVQLAEKVNLGDKGSVTIGDTVVNNNGITINSPADLNGVTNKTVSLTNQGLNNGGNKITNVAEGENDTDAVNVKQLKTFKDEVGGYGWNLSVNNGKDASKITKDTTVDLNNDDGNIKIAKNGSNVTLSLGPDVSLGKAGKDGKDGSLAVRGKDGASVEISGKDGSIGLTGPKGKDGTPGASATITVEKGTTTVNNDRDGEKQVNRIVYTDKDKDGNDIKREVATLDDGLKFKGDSKEVINRKLGSQVNITGGADSTKLTENNIGVVYDKATNGLKVKLSKDVNLGDNGTITIGDTVVNKDGLTINGGPSVTKGGVNAGNQSVTNVKDGTADNDAVNVKQLKAAKTEVEAGDHIDVTSRVGVNGQTIYKVSAKGINDTSAAVKGGSDHVKVTKANNTHKDGSTTVTDYTVDLSDKTKEDIKKGVDAHTEVTTKGLTFNADKGSTGVKKLGSKVSVNGDGKNITTTADENGVKVSMKDDIKVNSVTAKEVKVGDVNINENCINAGGKRITNVAPGKDGTDAVNVNQLKYVAGNISNQINNVDKGLRAGIAGALASGGLYHVTTAGKSMVSVGAGTYRGQNALAVGYSRLSDNGKVGVKFTVNSNSQGHAGASASVGYQW